MDTFTLNTLNKYINNYKHDIILKLVTENFTDKNISTQANLVNMVLDYSPKKKSTFQFPEKFDLTKFRTKPQTLQRQSKEKIPENINESKDEENTEQRNKSISSQKEENKSNIYRKTSESVDNNINNNNISHTPTENSNQNLKNNSFDNLRLIQKHQIRIYVLSKSNFFEIDFSPTETVSSLKKRIYTKLEHSVNIVLKHNTIEAYEMRPTKGMNII